MGLFTEILFFKFRLELIQILVRPPLVVDGDFVQDFLQIYGGLLGLLHQALKIPVGDALKGTEEHVSDFLAGEALLLVVWDSFCPLYQIGLTDVWDQAELTRLLDVGKELD